MSFRSLSRRSDLGRPTTWLTLGSALVACWAASAAQAHGPAPLPAVAAPWGYAVARGPVYAVPSTPRVDARQSRQAQRIAEGLALGALTPREAHLLRLEQDEIRRAEWRAVRDGVVTRDEQRDLDLMQDRARRHIEAQWRDDDRRRPHAVRWPG